VTTAIEHPSVLDATRALEGDGFETTTVVPDGQGIIHPEAIKGAFRDDTVLVSVMAANGEIGTLQPIGEIGAFCRERNIVFHTDATQAIGKIPVDLGDMNVDLASLSAHKFYGPKGVGALFVRSGIEMEPLFSGGGQERAIRPGTLNVPGIVGLGAVARLCQEDLESEADRQRGLVKELWEGIQERIPDAKLNGDREARIPGNLNVAIPRVSSERMMLLLGDYAFSASSACQSGKSEPSPVLTAIGLEADLIGCCVRFGLGKGTTSENVQELLAGIEKAVRRIRGPAGIKSSAG
jgi:cysteine desulfurase